jgi:hypothetical protein
VATAAQLFDQIAGSDSTAPQTVPAPAQQNSAADAFDKIASTDPTAPAPVSPGIHHGIPSLKGPSSTLTPGQELGLNAATAVQGIGEAGAAALPRTLSAIDGALQWMGFGAKAAPAGKTLLDVFPLAEESKPVVSHLLSDPAVRAAVAKAATKLVVKGSIMGLGLKGIEHLFSSVEGK